MALEAAGAASGLKNLFFRLREPGFQCGDLVGGPLRGSVGGQLCVYAALEPPTDG